MNNNANSPEIQVIRKGATEWFCSVSSTGNFAEMDTLSAQPQGVTMPEKPISKRKTGKQERGLKPLNDGTGRWRASWWFQGRNYRKLFPSKTEAHAARNKKITEIKEHTFEENLEKGKVKFKAAVDRFLKAGKSKLRESTQNNDAHIAKVWLNHPAFRNKRLNQISSYEIECFHEERIKVRSRRTSRVGGRFISKRWADYELARLKRMFSLAVGWGMLDKNPAAKVEFFHEDNKSLRWLTVEEEQRLLAVASPRLGRIIRIAIYTGMRKGEILNLRWSDVDFANKVIVIPGDRVKAGRERHIHLNVTALSTIKELTRPLNRKALVFENKRGKFNFNHGREWRATLQKSGIDHCRFHDLRHTFGSRLAMKGVPIMEIMKLMGHSSIAMAIRYSHLAPSKLQESVLALDSGQTYISTYIEKKSGGAA